MAKAQFCFGLLRTTSQLAEKPEFFEGDGLQAVHNCFAVNAALAAEGAIFSQSRLSPQPVNSAGRGQLYIKPRYSSVLQTSVPRKITVLVTI